MLFSCERPWAFYGLFLLIPVISIVSIRYIRLAKVMSSVNKTTIYRMQRRFFSRLIWWSLSWVMLVSAFSGLAWGVKPVAVQQSGSAVSFVFDISWSMMAKDISKSSANMTRLDAATAYANGILDELTGCEVSAIIAKGDGMVAVPLTSDYNAIRSLLSSLSPRLMTSVGSSIGKGINAAAKSFPVLSVTSKTIVVFTDGEETDDSLVSALTDVVRSGIEVIIVGFGSEKESQILAGDGKTMVATALRREKIEQCISTVNESVYSSFIGKKNSMKGRTVPKASFFNALDTGSAFHIIEKIGRGNKNDSFSSTVYEMEIVSRWRLFCFLALFFLIIGFIFSELDLSRFRKSSANVMVVFLCVFSTFFFSGCSAQRKGATEILKGTFYWYKMDYRESVASFMRAVEFAESENNSIINQYGVYGLASTYLAQGESDAAFERINTLDTNVSDNIKASAFYNAGIISFRKGQYQEAADFFKKSLLVDGSNINAKINLELSLRQKDIQASKGAQEVIPVSEEKSDSSLENTLFSLVREGEESRWKNQQSQENFTTGVDY